MTNVKMTLKYRRNNPKNILLNQHANQQFKHQPNLIVWIMPYLTHLESVTFRSVYQKAPLCLHVTTHELSSHNWLRQKNLLPIWDVYSIVSANCCERGPWRVDASGGNASASILRASHSTVGTQLRAVPAQPHGMSLRWGSYSTKYSKPTVSKFTIDR